MPHRTKHEAELRLSMGVARVALHQGKSPRQGLQAVRDHIALLRVLDSNGTTSREVKNSDREKSDRSKTRARP